MKTLRGKGGQSRFRHHHLARCPTLAREASGDVTESLSLRFLIGKSYDDHDWSLMAFMNFGKLRFSAARTKIRIALEPGKYRLLDYDMRFGISRQIELSVKDDNVSLVAIGTDVVDP
jgi:hypothetical protein